MALEKNIKLKVTADTKQAEQNLGNVDKKVGGITSSLKTMAMVGGVAFGVNFIKQSIGAYIEQERVAAKLNNTLGYNTKSLRDYASELQNKTRFEDDAIISGMSLLGLYVKDEKTLKDLTKATLDLASAKQMDLSSAFEVVSKAVSGNIGMLSRYGIRIESTGSQIQDTQLALEKIGKLMGGSAEAEKNTTYGKIESLKNAFGDLQEVIGEKFIPALSETISLLANLIKLDFAGLYNNLNNIGIGISDFITGQGEFKKQLTEMIKNQGTIGGTVLGGLIGDRNHLEQVAEGLKKVKKEVKEVVKEITDWQKVQTQARGREQWFASNGASIAGMGIGKGTFGIEGLTGAGAGKDGFDFRMKNFMKENSFFVEQMRSDIGILQGEFSKFWTDTFGEANSLLEMFLQNFAMGLADLAAKSLFSSILNFLLPGVGTIAGQALGKTTNPTQVNLVLDDTTIAKVYITGKEKAVRLRLD